MVSLVLGQWFVNNPFRISNKSSNSTTKNNNINKRSRLKYNEKKMPIKWSSKCSGFGHFESKSCGTITHFMFFGQCFWIVFEWIWPIRNVCCKSIPFIRSFVHSVRLRNIDDYYSLSVIGFNFRWLSLTH